MKYLIEKQDKTFLDFLLASNKVFCFSIENSSLSDKKQILNIMLMIWEIANDKNILGNTLTKSYFPSFRYIVWIIVLLKNNAFIPKYTVIDNKNIHVFIIRIL